MDDMIYIFHHNVILMNGFEKIEFSESPEHEWIHTNIWKSRNINLNVIGINLQNTKHHAYSGNVNI